MTSNHDLRDAVQPLRDATAHELRDEPDIVLQAMAEGSIRCTETTRQLARQEQDYRRLQRARRRRP
jgi:hypothetical protein